MNISHPNSRRTSLKRPGLKYEEYMGMGERIIAKGGSESGVSRA